MGWEMRGSSGPYYYHKSRGLDGRTRSEYIGNGPMAVFMAESTAAIRGLRQYRGAALRSVLLMLDGLGDAVQGLTERVDAEFGVRMERAGYQYIKGAWRRPRRTHWRDPFEPAAPLPVLPLHPRASDEPDPIAKAFEVDTSPCPVQVSEQDFEALREAGQKADQDDRHVFGSADPVLVRVGIEEAKRLRYFVEHRLREGEGDRTHPDYVALSSAAIRLAAAWGGRPFTVEEAERRKSTLGQREWKGRRDQGRSATMGPHHGSGAVTALALAGVLDGLGIEGRITAASALAKHRSSRGYDGAGELGRAVIDQHAFAFAYALVVSTLSHAAGEGAAPSQSVHENAPPRWAERRRKAERELKRASRLLGHAKRMGLLGPRGGELVHEVPSAGGRVLDDPMVALLTPPPLDPLCGEAAARAAADRDHIRAVRAAWPPPDRIRRSELERPEFPWKAVWEYRPDCSEDRDQDDPWMVPSVSIFTPEELEADLASWAPDFLPAADDVVSEA